MLSVSHVIVITEHISDRLINVQRKVLDYSGVVSHKTQFLPTYVQITFDTMLYSLIVYPKGCNMPCLAGVIDTWGAYTTDVREANLCSCVYLVYQLIAT